MIGPHRVRTIALYVADPAASRQFYEQHLGLKVTRDHRGRVEFDVGGTRLLLHPTDVDSTDRAGSRHGRVEVYLEVGDIDEVVAELVGSGVELMQEPTDEPWGERDAAVVDPDGFPVFLTEVL